MRPVASDWHLNIARLLLAAPVVLLVIGGAPYPVPPAHAVRFAVCIGLALGAAVFILRRRPREIIAWAALLMWGGLTTIALINAVTEASPE